MSEMNRSQECSVAEYKKGRADRLQVASLKIGDLVMMKVLMRTNLKLSAAGIPGRIVSPLAPNEDGIELIGIGFGGEDDESSFVSNIEEEDNYLAVGQRFSLDRTKLREAYLEGRIDESELDALLESVALDTPVGADAENRQLLDA